MKYLDAKKYTHSGLLATMVLTSILVNRKRNELGRIVPIYYILLSDF